MNKLKFTFISLLFCAMWQSAWAARDSQNWDELAENEQHKNNLRKEEQSDKYVVYVTSAMDLASYVYLLNNSKSNSVEFAKYNKAELIFENDIDLDAHVWRGISEVSPGAWKGSIDGRGHTIRNMHLYNNGDFSGLIDEVDEATTVKNLHFVNCDNDEQKNAKSILVGRVLNGQARMTVENVSFTNCKINNALDSSGLICGHVYENGASIDINNVTITNCSVTRSPNVVLNAKCTAAGIGYVKQSNVTATNVKMDGINVDGGEYTGGFIGWAEFSSKLELDNIDIRNANIKATGYLGGIVGEWQGTGYLHNSRWQGMLSSQKSVDTGGLIGKLYGSWTKVTIDNCVADVSYEDFFVRDTNKEYKNRYVGGAVASLAEAAGLTMTNTSVLANSSRSDTPSARQGMLIGTATANCQINVLNCHIDDYYHLNRPEIKIEDAAFSSVVKAVKGCTYSNLTGLTTLNDGEKPLYYIAQINEKGGRLGANYTPLQTTQGMVVRYKAEDNTRITSSSIPFKAPYQGYVFATIGDEITYTFTPSDGKWVVEDKSEGVLNSQCVGAGTFKATPSADLKQNHKLTFNAVDIPRIAILNESGFNRERQAVVLKWAISNQNTTDNYWRNDGYWQILRDGKVIADNIRYNSREYIDESCPLGSTCEYSVNLVSPRLHFNGNQMGDYKKRIVCQDNIKLRATIVEEGTRRKVTTTMPNSKRFDQSRVSLYRLTNEDIEQAGGSIGSLLTNSKYQIATTTYAYQPQSSQDTLLITLSDDSNQRPCTMFHYYIVCDQLQDSYYKDYRFVSNDCPIKPAKSVKLTSINAAKGESAERVKIDWTSRHLADGAGVCTYKVWRKKYDPDMAGMTAAQDTAGWTMIYEVNNSNTTNSYTDQTMPGYVYKYMVRAYVGCDGVMSDALYEDELTDIGYTASRGTIMGNITFGVSRTNVQGVDVRLAADSLSMINKGSTAYARYFSGAADRLPLAPNMGSQYWQGNWTMQYLLRPLANETENKALLHIPGLKDITLQQNAITIAGRKMPIKEDDYTRIMISHEGGTYKLGYADTPSETNGSYSNWVVTGTDAELGEQRSDLANDMVVFGAAGQLRSFHGMLDEVRLWNIALSETQVKNTYDRYLTGNESNLAAYYTFDSGVVEYAFDESHPDGIWNKRHTALPVIAEGEVLPGLRSDLCPSDIILCYRGTTDHNGEYQIAGIPFTGEGTNYMVVPVFGTHEFMPSSTRRYVSGQSLTHSSVNFSDISSFPVDIQAYYAMGNYPAEGLNVFIDGSAVTTKDGKGVVTDVNGRCTVNVPVGKHRLYLSGVNHKMVNDGYPCSIESISDGGIVSFKALQDADNLIDFQYSPVAPLTFFDNTYARVAGRVVGGNVESDKPLGANFSNANIGQVEITLEPSERNGYLMNHSETRDIQLDQKAVGGDNYNEVINSTTTYKRASSDIVIKTDPKSGEFLALLPPVNMRIKDIHTTGTYGKLLWEDFNTGNQSDLITIDMKNEKGDSILFDSKGQLLPDEECRVFTYNAKKIYSYFVEPTIEVVNPSNIGGRFPQMLGDSIWVNRYEEIVGNDTIEVEDVVKLWNPTVRDGSPQSYMLYSEQLGRAVPVFTMGNDYDLDISLFERYRSCDTGRDSLYFIPNVEIKITNTLATQKVTAKMSNGVMQYTLDTDHAETNVPGAADGKTRYTFSAGFPNPTAPYTLDLSMSYATNGKVYTYPAEGTIKGIVMGYVNVPGTDFVTAGPDQVSFVLRDPPGGGSSAWIEQGSTITSSASYDNVGSGSQDGTAQGITGTKMQKMSGSISLDPTDPIQIELTSQSDQMSSSTYGINTSWRAGTNKSAKLNYTLTQKLSTSGGGSYVGANGDVYIGRGTNYIFSKSRILGLRKSSAGALSGSRNTYALEQYDGFSQTIDFATVFNYTQRHIITELIPGWRNLRRACVSETVDNFDGIPQHVLGNSPRYYVLKTTSDKKDVWEEGVDYVCRYPNNSSRCYSDTINIINNQIISWQQAIKNNERVKVMAMRNMNTYTYTQKPDITTPGIISKPEIAMDYGYMGNMSYDAGVSTTKTITRDTNITTGTADEGSIFGSVNEETKIKDLNSLFGVELKTKHTLKEGYTHKGSSSKSESQKQTFGYTLSDSKPGNYFSIDTWLPGELKADGTLLELSKGGAPKLDEFFVFRLVGGQSRDPYEPEEYTLFYKENGKPVKLSEGTIAIENPKLTVSQPVFTDIPNGQKQAFEVTLSNESNANVKVGTGFTLTVLTGTNPDGLKFTIDGVPLLSSGGFEVFLKPGDTVQKTIIAEQTKLDVTHYENIQLRFACSGEPGRAVTEKVSFHFKPASSPVTLAADKPIVNSEVADTTLVLKVSDYQPEFENFAGIRIQYKELTETTWHTATVLVNDSLLLDSIYGTNNFPQVWQHLDKKAERMLINVPMGYLADGAYTFRAQSFSPVGKNGEVTTESEEITVLKDITAPTLLTQPTPEYGIYTGQENISIEMNEPIDMALLTDSNFKVMGILNDAEVRHQSGLHFDGNAPAHTQSRVNIFGESSTVAFWYKPQVRSSCLLSQQITQLDGTPSKIALYYNEDATLTLKLGNKEYKSSLAAVDADKRPIDDWMYATIIIDREKSEINVFNLFGTSTQAESHFLQIKDTNVSGECNVPLYVGGSSDGDLCHADMEELVLYDGAQTFATVASYKGNRHYDHLNILEGYWPMDEGGNMVAADKVRSRNLVLQGTDNWYMPVTNYAVHFDGKNQYIRLHTEQCPISSKQNYALEFHFRTDEKSLADTQTLFSNGWGAAGSPEPSLKERLSLSLDKQGQILFCAAGNTTTLNGNFADQNWHHLLLHVNRTGYARVYVDGKDISGITNIGGNELGGLANATMTLGALAYYNGIAPQPVVGNFFKGDIDEVRLWNANTSLETISNMASKRLSGNEVGLVAYYPFEHTTIVSNQPLTEPWLADCLQADEVTGIMPATDPEFVNNPTVAANGPRLKAAGINQPIDIKFTHDGDRRIILTFPDNLDKKRLEGCTLTFSAKNLKDIAGNKMLQPVIWNVFVEQKSIVAWTETNNLKQDIGTSTETMLTIYNDNPTAQRWTISSIPSWLSAERISNVIEPFSVQYIKLTTDAGAPVGKYSATLIVAGEDNLANYVNFDLDVTGVHPDWVAEKNGGNVWMSLMGRLQVDGAWSTDEDDMVAAFTDDGRCLGVASPQYDESMNTYFLHMDIRGKSTDEGKTLKFYVWDAASDIIYTDTQLSYVLSGQTHTAEDNLVLRSSKVLGNFNNPFVISTREVIRQNISLHEGWNWISFWVEPKTGKKASDIFAPVAYNLTEVKSRTQGYYTDQLDNLNISLSQAYLVYAKSDVSFSVEGTKASPDAIDMTLIHPEKKGDARWHWLGYPVHTSLPLQTAFSDFRPSIDDVVKGEDSYAMFNGNTWIGNLKYLTPGKGYIYGYNAYNNSDVTWHYPTKARATVSTNDDYTLDVDPYYYENYTFLKVRIQGLQTVSGRYKLAAIGQDDYIHGVAENQGNSFYLNIYGNDGDKYRFTLLDTKTGEVTDFDVIYDFDAVTPSQVITISTTTDITPLNADGARRFWYGVDGIRMGSEKPSQKGIYINNSKKQTR